VHTSHADLSRKPLVQTFPADLSSSLSSSLPGHHYNRERVWVSKGKWEYTSQKVVRRASPPCVRNGAAGDGRSFNSSLRHSAQEGASNARLVDSFSGEYSVSSQSKSNTPHHHNLLEIWPHGTEMAANKQSGRRRNRAGREGGTVLVIFKASPLTGH